jgi:hypothetical protein
MQVILEARRIDIIRYLNFYFNHSWFENNKSIMMCKGGIAILNYGWFPLLIKLTATILTEILFKVALSTINQPNQLNIENNITIPISNLQAILLSS